MIKVIHFPNNTRAMRGITLCEVVFCYLWYIILLAIRQLVCRAYLCSLALR